MNRLAILDIKNQDIGLKIVYPESDYFVIYDEFDKDASLKKYNIEKKYDYDNINDKRYDYLFIIVPFYNTTQKDLNDFYKGFQIALKIIEENNFKKVIVFDNYDYDYDPNDYLDNKKIDYYFKRNYNKKKEYKMNVIPFSFIMFGYYSMIEVIDNNRRIGKDALNRIFFGGALYNHIDDEMKVYRNRFKIYNEIQEYIFNVGSGLSHKSFMDELNNSKYCLDLNGVGDPNKKTFEILAEGSLRLGEYNDLRWCFDEDFCEETIFKDGEEFKRKIMALQDVDLYNKCLKRQEEIFDKYFNKEWIRSYINRFID